MVHIRFTGLSFGLLLIFLVALDDHYSFATAHGEFAATHNDDQVFEGNLEVLAQETKGVGAVTQSKGMMRGRKMGVMDEVKKETGTKAKRSVNTGESASSGTCEDGGKGELNIKCQLRINQSSPMKQFGSPITQDARTSAILESSPSITASKKIEASVHEAPKPSKEGSLHDDHSNDSMQTIDPQKLKKIVDELSKMLNKDYHARARRRPPINNNLPLEEEDNAVEP